MLELNHICKDYMIDKKPFPALKDINLFFPKQEFCAILGASGSGKTTILNIIGGLDRYTSGDLIIEGTSTKVYTDKEWDNYRNKRVGFVFQSYNLVPHITIQKNVELAMTLQGVGRKERTARAKEALDKVGLKDLYNKKPNQLSGGQMQRVAIARALVNNPEIILADEPTGALDSVTSVQILDILKEVSKTKLVIMVTHNDSLAYQYADRIIKFKDGEILDDSKHSEVEERAKENEEYQKTTFIKMVDEKDKKHHKKEKKEKTSMSFLTSLNLSFQNIRSKKVRTIMTSVASSFGIIGVALVLALNNGFSTYIDRIESETASSLPISVPSSTVTYSYVDSSQYNQTTKFPNEQEVYPYVNTSQMQSAQYTYNNFSTKYFSYLDKLRDEDNLINDYLINYSSGYEYHLTTEYPESLNGSTAALVGLVSTSYSSSYSFNSLVGSVTGLPSTAFHTLYGEEKYIMENYDLIDGSYPKENNELVLVVDQYNRVDFSTLQALGFYSQADTYNDILDSSLASKVKPISWDDILNKKYKVFTNDEYYTKITSQNTGTAAAYKAKSLTDLYNDDSVGTEMKVVGILRPTKKSTISLMSTGLCSLPSFQNDLVKTNNESDLNKNYIKNVQLKSRKDSEDNDITKENFIARLLKIFNSSSDTQTSSVSTLINNLFDEYFTFYSIFANGNNVVPITATTYYSYAKRFAVSLIPDELKNIKFGTDSLPEIISYLTDSLASDETFYKNMIGLGAYMNNYSDISSVIIFPKDLSSKADLLKALDSFNEISSNKNDPYHATSASEQVFYTDVGSTLTDSLGQMINIITVVLIIFASISLLVSCVMTGIITYTSVLERTKEIGILRAIGARKRDVGNLFQAESFIIGLLAGVVGCVVAALICIPINAIINVVYADYNIGTIASLNIVHAIILVLISVCLTFISGLVPARVAARKDPVTSLRSE